MRVTPSTMYLTLANNLQHSLGRVQDAQERLASGKRINKLSDAPADAAAALRMRAEESNWESYAQNADDAIGWLDSQDQALQSASTVLRRVRDLTVSAGNSDLSQPEREALAEEIDAIKRQIAGLANTTYLGCSLFGGFAGRAVSDTFSWVGHPANMTDPMDLVQRQVAPQVTVSVNLDGRQVFGYDQGPGKDVFSMLDKVSADVRSGNATAVTSDIDLIDGATKAITEGLLMVGVGTNQVEAAKESGSAQLETLKSNRSTLEDADIPASVMDLQLAQIGYQATLGAVAKLSMPSLADFLR